MADQIIFRLLDINKRVCGYCRWNIGSLDTKNFYDVQPQWEYSNTCEEWHDQEIVHRHKERFADQKDKTGKLIFEGDILKNDYRKDIYFMKWTDNTFSGKHSFQPVDKHLQPYEYYYGNWDVEEFEIIGHIHENPERLK